MIQILAVLIASLFALPSCACAKETPKECCKESFKISKKSSLHPFADDPDEVLKDKVLYLLDQNKNVYLFRGGSPDIGGEFQYDGLVKDMRDLLAKQGKSLSDPFKLMDISFLNHLSETKEIDLEKNWFANHSDKGCVWLFPIYGSLVNPLDLTPEIRNLILTHYDVDGLKHLVHQLKLIMDSPCSSDFVIYIHCMAGKDRTGEVSAAYLMQHKGVSYQNAISLDQQIAARELKLLSMNAIRWYAFYLRDVKGITTIGEIDGK